MKQVDTRDLKSLDRKVMPVRFRPRALIINSLQVASPTRMNREAIEQYYTRHYHSKVAKLVATLRATLERTQSAIEKRT